MDVTNILKLLFFNPIIISLLTGFIIGIYTNLSLPRKLMQIISLYLVFTIGFKGGACLGTASQCTPWLFGLAIVGILIGFIQPFINHIILKKTTSLSKENLAVISAQYGSISIATFASAISFLENYNIPYDTFLSAIAGIMEIPALFSGLLIIKQEDIFNKKFFSNIINIIKSILLCNAIIFIFIGFFSGYISRYLSLYSISSENIDYVIVKPFSIMLIFFILDIGLKIAKQRSYLKYISLPIFSFGIYVPIISGFLGVLIASKFVYFAGSALLFGILTASASYIAVPAIMRMEAKNAQEAIYMPMTLGITLPFNIIIGIPLFYYLASLLF